jgi:hypothetical protein
MVFASSATASSHHPKGEFANFGECPLNNPLVEECLFSVSSGGSFTVGKKTVPLVNPVTLQGGAYFNAAEEQKFLGAENGDTLSKTPQPVPGGLLGITAPTWWPKFIQEWFNNLINEGFTGVTATVELAAPATSIKLSTQNLINGEGTALGLPTKIKLSNAILGSNFYVGSNSSPVQINFTTGTGGSDRLGRDAPVQQRIHPGDDRRRQAGQRHLRRTGHNGCGGIFSFLVGPLVDEILGVPSASGKNTAILEGKLQDANANAVRASE